MAASPWPGRACRGWSSWPGRSRAPSLVGLASRSRTTSARRGGHVHGMHMGAARRAHPGRRRRRRLRAAARLARCSPPGSSTPSPWPCSSCSRPRTSPASRWCRCAARASAGRCGRTAAFLAGLAVCAFATNGSIAVYDQVLFTAHMAGHLALVMVAPALLVAGRPLTPARWPRRAGAPARGIERVAARAGRRRCSPRRRSRWPTYTAVIVGSHLTGLMDTIMRNTWAGQVEHLVYLLAGCQFFVLIVGDEPIRWRLASPARWLLLAIAMAVDTFTGIVLMQGTHAVAPAAVRAATSTRCPTPAPAARSCGSAATRSWPRS